MKKMYAPYRTAPALRRANFSISSTVTTILLAAAASARAADQGPAAAAAPEEQPLQEVVITGIRKSVEDSISAKKTNSSIIEAVSAEDIGKLPDESIAESISRLPGVASQRTNGRSQTLSIRGLGPDFTVTTLNGREQASINDNRTVEFDQYPSELVSQVKVFKTPDAGMPYQGIAGTVDIETVRPLSSAPVRSIGYERDQDALKVQVPGGERGGDRASLFYIDQFMEHTVGVALGAAFNKTPYQVQTREPWGYASNSPGQGLPNGYEVIGGDKDGIKSAFFERLAFNGVLEYKPSDALHMVVDAYHSTFKELQTIRRMEYGTIWAGATLSTIGSTVPVDASPTVNTRVTSGTFTNVPFLVAENYNNDRHATLDAIGWNTEFKPSENWVLGGDLSWSRDKRTDLRLESTAGLGRNDASMPGFLPPPETVGFTTEANGVTHLTTTQNYSNYNTTFLTDPGNWGGGPTRSGYLGNPTVWDELKAIKLSALRKLGGGVFSDVSFGINYAERTKSKYQWQSALYLPNGMTHAVVPAAYQKGIVDTSFFGNPYGMINYDAYGLLSSGFWNTADSRVDPNANYGDVLSDYTNTWKVTEKLTTPYVKVDIDTHLGGVPLTGNIGVQTQTANQSSDIFYASPQTGGSNTVNGSVVNVGNKYTDVLPSMNLAFGLAPDLYLRAAAAVTVARPRMDDLAGGATFTTIADSQPPIIGPNGQKIYWTQGGGGNPQLRPWKANAFDLSLEKYFSNRAYLSAAVYYKQLKSYIYGRFTTVDFTGVPLPNNPGLTYTLADANRIGVGKISENGTGGAIQGVELTASVPFELLTPVLRGFGISANAAWNRSYVNPYGLGDVPVEGLSPKIFNTTLYYEQGGFSARISNRYRGGFVGEVPAYDSSLTTNNVKSESILDAQIGYSFESGPVKGLSVNLSGSNLTDAPFVLYQVGAPAFDIIKYEKYGATYAFLVRYKF